MKELIRLLEEKNIINKLQLTVNICPMPKGLNDKQCQELVNDAIASCLKDVFMHSVEDEDEDFPAKVIEYCFEVGAKQIANKLNLKPKKDMPKEEKIALLINSIFE